MVAATGAGLPLSGKSNRRNVARSGRQTASLSLQARQVHFRTAWRARFGAVARASYSAARIITRSWGRKKEYSFVLKDGLLSMTELRAGKTTTYRKLEKSPPEIQVKPLQLGNRAALSEESVLSIQAELKHRGKIDQVVRADPINRKEMARVDADNTSFLVKLVQEVGWIDVERFGASSSQTRTSDRPAQRQHPAFARGLAADRTRCQGKAARCSAVRAVIRPPQGHAR